MKRVYIIVGAFRPHWLGKQIAKWVRYSAKTQVQASLTIVDAEDIDLPGVVSNNHPSRKKYTLTDADAYILITPEYEGGTSNIIDRLIVELKENDTQKPVAFVSYGQLGGKKIVDSLRQQVKRINMAPLRNAVHIAKPWDIINSKGELHDADQEQDLSIVLRQLRSLMAAQPAAA